MPHVPAPAPALVGCTIYTVNISTPEATRFLQRHPPSPVCEVQGCGASGGAVLIGREDGWVHVLTACKGHEPLVQQMLDREYTPAEAEA